MFNKLSPESAKLRKALVAELRERIAPARKEGIKGRLQRLKAEKFAEGGEVKDEDEDEKLDDPASADLEEGEGEATEDGGDEDEDESLDALIERLGGGR